jgi:hypothetical protein
MDAWRVATHDLRQLVLMLFQIKKPTPDKRGWAGQAIVGVPVRGNRAIA